MFVVVVVVVVIFFLIFEEESKLVCKRTVAQHPHALEYFVICDYCACVYGGTECGPALKVGHIVSLINSIYI